MGTWVLSIRKKMFETFGKALQSPALIILLITLSM